MKNINLSTIIDFLPHLSFALMITGFSSYYFTSLQNDDLDMKLIALGTFVMTIVMKVGPGNKIRNTGISWCIMGAADYLFKEISRTTESIGINDYILLILIVAAPFFVRFTQRKNNA